MKARMTEYQVWRKGKQVASVKVQLLDQSFEHFDIRNGDVLKSHKVSYKCNRYGWERLSV